MISYFYVIFYSLLNLQYYSETLELNASSEFDSVRNVRKIVRQIEIEIEFLIFFLTFRIFMIRFGRIELAFYSNKVLDSMQKRLLTRVHENLKKNKKKIKN